MCLYPKLIKNKRYIPNKSNNYNPPICKDERLLYVPVKCGNCIECRKAIANEWKIRLNNELKEWKYKYFVTLTFNNESLEELIKETKKTINNATLGLAIRRFTERYRKKYKKTIKHFFITELGHKNTERPHIHGIIFTNKEDFNIEFLEKLWKYGKCDIGKFCNSTTIGYIVKYITKIDNQHKDYKPSIYTSKGIGKNYINNFTINKYKYNNNYKEYYTSENGIKYNLPIYYRNKIFNETEREKLWINKIEQHRIYINGIKYDLNKIDTKTLDNIRKKAQEDNIKAGYGDDSKEWKKKDYNLTLQKLNKMKKMQSKDYN